MEKAYRALSAEARASYGITEDGSDESWVYCTACGRAMEQGDCVLDDAADSLQCAYDDCMPDGSLAFESLYGWDAYRQMYGLETADWPEIPTAGDCYRRPGTGS
jgi:hypothetical protein